MAIFNGLFDTDGTSVISITDFLLCIGVSLVLGALLALVYSFRTRYTKSFLITLGVLPSIVCMIIMVVNGNVGIGVAVAGAFSLVRFRSVAGTAKEIAVLFLAMAAGLIVGTGYLAYAALFTVMICAVLMLSQLIKLPQNAKRSADRTLRITIPEDLDYSSLFDDVFEEYASEYKILTVKTTNMGSLFKVTYNITEKDVSREKEMLDAIRLRNGNLEISLSEQETRAEEL